MIRKPPRFTLCHWIFLEQERHSQEEEFPQGSEYFLCSHPNQRKRKLLLSPKVQHGRVCCLENPPVWTSDGQDPRCLFFCQTQDAWSILCSAEEAHQCTGSDWPQSVRHSDIPATWSSSKGAFPVFFSRESYSYDPCNTHESSKSQLFKGIFEKLVFFLPFP